MVGCLRPIRTIFLFLSAIYWGACIVLLAVAAVSGAVPDLLGFVRGAILFTGFWLAAWLAVIAVILFVSWWWRGMAREHRLYDTGYSLLGFGGGDDGADCGSD